MTPARALALLTAFALGVAVREGLLLLAFAHSLPAPVQATYNAPVVTAYICTRQPKRCM